MQVRARVRALEEGAALVEVLDEGCGRCHEAGGCGGHHLTRFFCSAPRTFFVDSCSGVEVGTEVTIALPVKAVFAAATLAYVLPVLALLAGALVGMVLGDDRGAMLGGLAGLLAAWLAVRRMLSGAGNRMGRPNIIATD